MKAPVVVVGAGASGLGCAIELASCFEVAVVDRNGAAGGCLEAERPWVQEQVARAKALGVRFQFGVCAIRWSGEHLTAVARGRFVVLPARRLFYAGGRRSSSSAELCLAGHRPAEVFFATGGIDGFQQAAQADWSAVAIIGNGPHAVRAAEAARRLGLRVVGIASEGAWADEMHPVPSRWFVERDRHLSGIRLDYDDAASGPRTVRVACEAIVLADGAAPARNIEGAVLPSAQGVTYVQPSADCGCEWRLEAAREVARDWMRTAAATVQPSVRVSAPSHGDIAACARR